MRPGIFGDIKNRKMFFYNGGGAGRSGRSTNCKKSSSRYCDGENLLGGKEVT